MRIENGKWKVENGGVQDTFHFPFSIFNSNVVLRCVAYGGVYGGTLTLARNGAFQRKLSQVGGDLLPSSVQVPPETVLTFEAEYEPVAPSDAANDILATAAIVEDFLNETHTNATTFTSVRIKMCPRYCADGNNSSDRHVLGVDEYVNTIITPTGVSAEWLDDVDVDVDLNNTSFWCPWQGGAYHPTFLCMGTRYQTTVHIVEPKVVCRAAWWNGYLGMIGVAGEITLNLSLYVEPDYVSFKDLNLQEIPDEIDRLHTGYFNDKLKGGAWSHTSAAGAGTWHSVQDLGFWTYDAAGVHEYVQPWCAGYKVWNIPVGWGIGNEIYGRVHPDPTCQEFWITEEGTVTVRKYDHEITRTIYCQVILDGVFLQ